MSRQRQQQQQQQRSLQRGQARLIDLADFEVHLNTTTNTAAAGLQILDLVQVVTPWLVDVLDTCLNTGGYNDTALYAPLTTVDLLERVTKTTTTTTTTQEQDQDAKNNRQLQIDDSATTEWITTALTGTARFTQTVATQLLVPTQVVLDCQASSYTDEAAGALWANLQNAFATTNNTATSTVFVWDVQVSEASLVQNVTTVLSVPTMAPVTSMAPTVVGGGGAETVAPTTTTTPTSGATASIVTWNFHLLIAYWVFTGLVWTWRQSSWR